MTFDQHRVGLTSFLTILGVRWMFISPFIESITESVDGPLQICRSEINTELFGLSSFNFILWSGTLFQSTRNIKIFILIVNKISFWAHLPKHWRFSWPYLTRHLDIPIWPSFLCSLFTDWNMNVKPFCLYIYFCLIKSIKFYFCSIYAGKR